VALIQIGLNSMGVVDTLMVGRVSAEDLAAVALGNILFFMATVLGMGILMGLDPLVAQAAGAGDREGAARALQRGLILSLVLTVFLAGLLLLAGPLLRVARQPEEVVPIAVSYVMASLPGILPFLVFIVFRQTLQAMGRVAPILWTALAANGVNLFLNWVLIWGNLGVPPLGAVGSAWASSLSRGFMAVALLGASYPILRGYLRPRRERILEPRPLVRMVGLGLPIGLQFQMEFGAFALIGVIMGWFGATVLAGHQVAITLASFAFMIPVGISAAAAVRVGQEVGREDPPAARRAAGAALILGMGFMLVTAAVFLGFPELLGRAFSPDPEVVAVVAVLLPIAGMFQVFDGLQAVAAGVLRGVGETRAPMLANLVGFWVLGIPLSLWLAFGMDRGPEGLWWGLALGLAVVALLLLVQVGRRMGRELRRLHMDG
jgi:multidrug resistance protein, MATE family